jgi:hypothetical protein
MAIVTLLDWCSANGIRIHSNLRIIHDEKMGICVRAADYPIMSDQSRKRFSPTFFFFTSSAIFAAAFRRGQLTTIHMPSSVDVSCRNP